MTCLPGAYEEETEALRFLDGFGTLPCLCKLPFHIGAEHHGTGGRRGLARARGRGCCRVVVSGKGRLAHAEPWRVPGGTAVTLEGGRQPGWEWLWGTGMCWMRGAPASSPAPDPAPHSTHRSRVVWVGAAGTWPMTRARRVGGGKSCSWPWQNSLWAHSVPCSNPPPPALPWVAGAWRGWGQPSAELGAVLVTQPVARIPPQCLALPRAAGSLRPRLLSWFLRLWPFLCTHPPHASKCSPKPRAVCSAGGGGRAAAPLHIHPLGFSGGFPRPWAERCKEQAHLGSARDTRGHVGPCSGLAPRSCSRLLPGAPGQDRGFLVLCSPSARPVLYLGPAAAWAALASSPLPGRGAGGGG